VDHTDFFKWLLKLIHSFRTSVLTRPLALRVRVCHFLVWKTKTRSSARSRSPVTVDLLVTNETTPDRGFSEQVTNETTPDRGFGGGPTNATTPDRGFGGGPTMTGPNTPDTGPVPVDSPVQNCRCVHRGRSRFRSRSTSADNWHRTGFFLVCPTNYTGFGGVQQFTPDQDLTWILWVELSTLFFCHEFELSTFVTLVLNSTHDKQCCTHQT
jgi:hypothetical protein